MNFEGFLGAVAKEEAKKGVSDKELHKMITDIVGIFKDPIILYPGGWEDTLPPRLWEEITTQRFVQEMKRAKGTKIEESTDAEALAYVYSASLVAPMGPEWTNIYLWLGKHYGDAEFSKVTPRELSSDEKRMLEDLKRWIYRKKMGARSKKVFPLKAGYPKKRERSKAAIGCPHIIEADYGSE